MSQTRSDAEDLDGASADVEPQDADELDAEDVTTRSGSDRKSAEKTDRKKAAKRGAKPAAKADKKKPARKRRVSPMLFYRQIVAELRKVVWPTRSELFTYTTVVIVFVLIIIGFVAVMDAGFSRLVQAIFG